MVGRNEVRSAGSGLVIEQRTRAQIARTVLHIEHACYGIALCAVVVVAGGVQIAGQGLVELGRELHFAFQRKRKVLVDMHHARDGDAQRVGGNAWWQFDLQRHLVTAGVRRPPGATIGGFVSRLQMRPSCWARWCCSGCSATATRPTWCPAM